LARQPEERVVIAAAHHSMLAPQETWPVPLYTGVTIVGSGCTNTGGILSGFTSSSYATMPFYFTSGASSLEAVCSVTASTNNEAGIWGCVGSTNAFTPFYIPHSKNYISAYISSDGSSWNISDPVWSSSYVAYVSPVVGTHLLKIVYSNADGYRQYRFENGGWTLCGSIANTAPPYGSSSLVMQLGTNRGRNNPFLGTIDLNYTYLMRDGQLWWEGVAGAYRNVKTIYPD
jgi:hypothetical protein